MGTVTRFGVKALQTKTTHHKRFYKQLLNQVKSLVLDKGWLLNFVALLIGRAIILTNLSPFAVAFIAAIWLTYRQRLLPTMMFVAVGALSQSFEHGIFIVFAMFIFFILAYLFQQSMARRTLIALFVFLSLLGSRVFFYSLTGQLTAYQWLMIAVEGLLSVMLVLIFMQSIPLLLPNKYKQHLKSEEIVCLIILLASILTGFIGWTFYGAALEHIFSRYFVLIFSFVGGAAMGSTVGVVAGLILSLAYVSNVYQMSLLAFSGLLGGLLKEGKKIGVSIGMLVGTCLVDIYSNPGTLFPSLLESSLAISLFLLTPAHLFKQLARYIPGTVEHTQEQEQYLQKVRRVTAKRVEQFSHAFDALAKSFQVSDEQSVEETVQQRETDYFLSYVTEATCQQCFLKEHCWKKQFQQTYSLMEEMKYHLTTNEDIPTHLSHEFRNHCVKSTKVVDTMEEYLSFFTMNQQLKKQVVESKRLVANQLHGVSKVMDDFAQEILKERRHHEQQESEIYTALKEVGIEVEKLEIFQLDRGNIDIEMTLSFFTYRGEGSKLIAPLLSHILNETIVVTKEEISPFPNGYCYLAFGSAKQFIIQTGIAHAAKGGGIVSGDSYQMIEIDDGKYALAISDGMGNGQRAREESRETLRLLRQILQTGIEEKVAIQSINSILSLRTTDEMFATLDLAVVNLHNAYARFLKVGSSPSFIKRQDEFIQIKTSNLPIGIVNHFDFEVVNKQLRAGDYLFMMSDGVFEGPTDVVNPDVWFQRKIFNLKTEDPQEMADLILEEVIRTQSGVIKDDMTILVAKVMRNTPKWTSIPFYTKKTSTINDVG